MTESRPAVIYRNSTQSQEVPMATNLVPAHLSAAV